jgi:carboxyl-terminal processing protease
VLLKIDSHYGDTPRWKDLVDRGTSNLELALSERTFVDRNVPQRDQPAIDAFRRELRTVIDAKVVNNRADARDAVAAAAGLAQQRLEIASAAVVLEYLCGATNALDAYSTFLTPDQLNETYAQIEGNFVGLGVVLKAQDGRPAIVQVIAGSPAEEAGIRAGDRILAVNGLSTKDVTTDQAFAMLQGTEGSVVTLVVAAPGQSQRQVSVRRRRVDAPSIDQVRIIDAQNGIGYFKLTCFQKTTARELDTALWKLHHDGMRSLVIDVRGNPGGLLSSAPDVADRFIDRGVLVSTHGRSPQEDLTFTAHDQAKWQMPLVVLIDQDSASAAEIFAGAIRDHHRGTIIGVRSFGKGTVQCILPLDGYNSGLRLTTAKFYSPNGKPFNHIGVEPDIQVQVAARPIDGKLPSGGDAMLTAAMQALTPSLQARSGM